MGQRQNSSVSSLWVMPDGALGRQSYTRPEAAIQLTVGFNDRPTISDLRQTEDCMWFSSNESGRVGRLEFHGTY